MYMWDQKTALWNQFSSSHFMWVLETELYMLSHLVDPCWFSKALSHINRLLISGIADYFNVNTVINSARRAAVVASDFCRLSSVFIFT